MNWRDLFFYTDPNRCATVDSLGPLIFLIPFSIGVFLLLVSYYKKGNYSRVDGEET